MLYFLSLQNVIHVIVEFTESGYHKITELAGAYKAMGSNPLLSAVIQVKADLTQGWPIFS